MPVSHQVATWQEEHFEDALESLEQDPYGDTRRDLYDVFLVTVNLKIMLACFF